MSEKLQISPRKKPELWTVGAVGLWIYIAQNFFITNVLQNFIAKTGEFCMEITKGIAIIISDEFLFTSPVHVLPPCGLFLQSLPLEEKIITRQCSF